MKKDLICYTIGHSTSSIEKFLSLLEENKINCIVDVRSFPYSKIASQYNKDEIKKTLKTNNIYYIFLGKELGARYNDLNLFENGIVSFKKVSITQNFQSGIKRIVDGINKKYKIALMCSERDPINCHRFSLISRELHKIGIEVLHIFDNGILLSNEELEKKLIEIYISDFKQLSLLEVQCNDEDLIEKIYEKHNKKIGFSLKNED